MRGVRGGTFTNTRESDPRVVRTLTALMRGDLRVNELVGGDCLELVEEEEEE